VGQLLGCLVVWAAGVVFVGRRVWRLGRGRGGRCRCWIGSVLVRFAVLWAVGASISMWLLGLPRPLSRLLVYPTLAFYWYAFSVMSAYRLTSSSNSWSVARFFSFCGFGFFTTGGSAISSYTNISTYSPNVSAHHTRLNQSESSGLLAKLSMSSC
jgi:hypothetical protein